MSEGIKVGDIDQRLIDAMHQSQETQRIVDLGVLVMQSRDAKDYEKLQSQVTELTNKMAAAQAALIKLRDCDWVIRLPDRMDAVRDIARATLNGDTSALDTLLAAAKQEERERCGGMNE
jgi:hypothetical protein